MSAGQHAKEATITQTPGYVDPAYLRVVAEMIERQKRRTYELLRVAPGQSVLDVGCGPATDTIPLARLVGPSGRVVGVDHDPAMVAEARRNAEAAGVSGWTRHLQADATSLPLATGTFDGVRADRIFVHLPHPERAVAQLARVVRSGGRVVAMDADWATLSLAATDSDLERRYAQFYGVYLRGGYATRRLYGYFTAYGLEQVSVETQSLQVTSYPLCRKLFVMDQIEPAAIAAGALTPDDVARLRADLERADAEGRFFASVHGVIVAGTRP